MDNHLRMSGSESASTTLRRKKIIDELHEQDEVTVTGLSAKLGVSDVTIRKDLQQLDDQGYLTRVRGGAVFSGRGQLELRFAARQQLSLDEKRRMAAHAVDNVRPGSTIFLDGSSTVFQMTRLLRDTRGLTVITNGLHAALELSFAEDVTTIVVGGILRPQSSSLVDLLTPELLQRLHVDVAFMSCQGFTIEHGLMESDLREAQLKRSMGLAAQKVFGLADHTKLGDVFIASSMLADEIDLLITDSGIDKEYQKAIESYGMKLAIV